MLQFYISHLGAVFWRGVYSLLLPVLGRAAVFSIALAPLSSSLLGNSVLLLRQKLKSPDEESLDDEVELLPKRDPASHISQILYSYKMLACSKNNTEYCTNLMVHEMTSLRFSTCLIRNILCWCVTTENINWLKDEAG
jgi:hypothetical protein